jgi:hypothetical protein
MNSFIEIEISQIWWHTFMVLATWKAEVGGSLLKVTIDWAKLAWDPIYKAN